MLYSCNIVTVKTSVVYKYQILSFASKVASVDINIALKSIGIISNEKSKWHNHFHEGCVRVVDINNEQLPTVVNH